jgi:uncharacterized protein YfiM (DUF2279 family)
MMATPAMSHVGGTVGHLWNDHIKPRADARYVNAVAGTDRASRADGLNAIQIARSAAVTIPAGNEVSATAQCPAGTFVVGGGALSSFGSPDPYLNSSFANSTTSWRVFAWNPTGGDETTQAYAVCVAANSSTLLPPPTGPARVQR